MLRELFDGTCRVIPVHIEWKMLDLANDKEKKVEIIVEDSVDWKKEDDCLCVTCTRRVGFSPECNFSIVVSYAVEHILAKPHSLDTVSDDEIDSEVHEHIGYYIQENQGLMGRVSLIISQLTSAFGAPPLILPPSYQMESDI